MKKITLTVFLAGLWMVVALSATPVFAVSCSSLGSISAGSNFSCDFSDANVTQLDGAFTVTVSYNSALNQITLTATDNNLADSFTLAGFGFDNFGFDATGATIGSQTVSGNSWVTGGACNGNLDGFGSMDDCLVQSGGGTTASPAVFQLTSTPTSFDKNSNGAHFAIHYKTNVSGCTGFAGDLNVQATSNADCGTGSAATTATQSVPEPSSMLLLGSGLLALAKYARRKRN
jgi:PEP-CTERM motif